MPKKTILFVCTGNTCRSPMAETLLRGLLPVESPYEAASAGLFAHPGHQATPEAAMAMTVRRLSLDNFRSRQATQEMLEQADLVLGMTEGHVQGIRAMAPAANVYALGDYVGMPGDIADPYGRDSRTYALCAAQLEERVRALIERLAREDGHAL